MVLFCHQDSWECRAFRPNQIAPQAASPGTCTHRNRPPRCFLMVYKLTGPDSDSKAQVFKQHCFSLFYLTCLILPLALSLWPGVWVLDSTSSPQPLAWCVGPTHSKTLKSSNKTLLICPWFQLQFCSCLESRDPTEAVPSPGTSAMQPSPQRPGHFPEQDCGGKVGPLPGNHRPQPLLTWVPASLLAASQMPLSFPTHGQLASLHL